MFKIIYLFLIIISCGNDQNNFSKLDLNKKQEENRKLGEELQRIKEVQKNLKVLVSLIINNSENLDDGLEIFKAILKPEYINYSIDSNENEKLNGKTLLIIAIETQKLEFVEILLTYNELDVNKKSEEGKAPLEYAIENKNLAIIETLLKRDEIFIDRKYFSLYYSWDNKEMHKLLLENHKEKLKLSEELYKLFFEDNIDEEKIEKLLKKGASLNYSYYQDKTLLENYLILLKDKNKIKLLFKYGLDKETFQIALIRVIDNKLSKDNEEYLNINKDYFKFLLENIKIDLYFKGKKEKELVYNKYYDWAENPSYYTTLISQIYKNIKDNKGILEYLLSLPNIDLRNTLIITPTNEDNQTVFEENVLIALIKDKAVKIETVFLALEHPSLKISNEKLNINELIEKYVSRNIGGFLGSIILYRDSEANSLKLLEFFFKKGLNKNYLTARSFESQSFVDIVRDGLGRLQRARELAEKYYPGLKF